MLKILNSLIKECLLLNFTMHGTLWIGHPIPEQFGISLKDCYVYNDDVCTVHCVELDTDWEVMTLDNAKQIKEYNDAFFLEDYTEDVSWMASN